MRRDRDRLQDILDAIAAIRRYTQRGQQTFEEQELIQVWIVYHLQIIGEATNALSSPLLNRYSDIPWPQIIGLRNLIVHEYFKVDLQIIWDITQQDLPTLKPAIEQILKEMDNTE